MNPYLRITLMSLGLWCIITLLSSAVTGFPLVNPISAAIGRGLQLATLLRGVP